MTCIGVGINSLQYTQSAYSVGSLICYDMKMMMVKRIMHRVHIYEVELCKMSNKFSQKII